MDIIDRIHKMIDEWIHQGNKYPDYIYLGHQEVIQVKNAPMQYYNIESKFGIIKEVYGLILIRVDEDFHMNFSIKLD